MQDVLLKLARYPYISGHFLYSGMAVPFGEDISGVTGLNHLYITFPYRDDPDVYTNSPRGEMRVADRLVFVFWAIPIFEDEAQLLNRLGAEHFDRLLGEQSLSAHQLNRPHIHV